jgi:hypothetical protein
VTIRPPRAWTFVDVTEALKRDIERLGAHPVVQTWVGVGTGGRRELLAVRLVDGCEASAGRWIFQMGVLLNNGGWRVRRLRIDAPLYAEAASRRALYLESRVQVEGEGVAVARRLCFPIASEGGTSWAVLRTPDCVTMSDRLAHLISALGHGGYHPALQEVRAVTHDTAPDDDAPPAPYEGEI